MQKKERHTKSLRERANKVLEKTGLDVRLPDEDVKLDSDESFKRTFRTILKDEEE